MSILRRIDLLIERYDLHALAKTAFDLDQSGGMGLDRD